MLIDWFTVVAQVANFLILVWLLKRFLYTPVLNALDAREKRIATELADAEAKMREATAERDEFRRKNDEFDREHATRLNAAVEEAAVERRRLFDEARKGADSLRVGLQQKIEGEYQALQEELARRTQAEVFAIARKALTELVEASLEERMTAAFIRRLREWDAGELASVLKPSGEPVLVRTAFDLPPDQRALIQGALTERLSADIQVRFESVPDIVAGIELNVQGHKVAWSIAEYLASLERSVNELLKAQAAPEGGAAANTNEHRK